MAVLGWPVVFPVFEQPGQDLPNDTRMHWLLVRLMDLAPILAGCMVP